MYDYSMAPGRYCIACGELTADCHAHGCKNIDPESAEEFCDQCGAELNNHNTCDNDHDEWTVDVHCQEFAVTEVPHDTITDTDALDQIRNAMTGVFWNADTIEEVAGLVQRTGRTIEQPEGEEG